MAGVVETLLMPESPMNGSLPALQRGHAPISQEALESRRRASSSGDGRPSSTDRKLCPPNAWSFPRGAVCVESAGGSKTHGFQSHGNEQKQTWGSDLELASSSCCATSYSAAAPPSAHSSEPPSQGTLVSVSPSSKQNGDALLGYCSGIDLNLDLEEPPSGDTSKHCPLLVSEPARQEDAFLNLELRTAMNPQPLAISEEESCFSMGCFALESPICGNNALFYRLRNDSAKAQMKQITPCVSSDESIGNMSMGSSGMLRKMANFSSSDANCNSCAASFTTSNNSMHSATRINLVGFAGDRLYEESPATSTDHSWKEESSVTQSWHPLPANSEVNHRPRARVNSTSERITEITLNELSQYFHMPINQASKELKVGLTVLKKKCREFGIPRWPHRKMKSLDSLIHSIQDLAKDQGVKSSLSVMNAVRELEEQKKMMEEMPGTELAERTKRLRQACFKANYKKRKLIGPSSSSLPVNYKHSSNILDLNRTLITSANQIGFL